LERGMEGKRVRKKWEKEIREGSEGKGQGGREGGKDEEGRMRTGTLEAKGKRREGKWQRGSFLLPSQTLAEMTPLGLIEYDAICLAQIYLQSTHLNMTL